MWIRWFGNFNSTSWNMWFIHLGIRRRKINHLFPSSLKITLTCTCNAIYIQDNKPEITFTKNPRGHRKKKVSSSHVLSIELCLNGWYIEFPFSLTTLWVSEKKINLYHREMKLSSLVNRSEWKTLQFGEKSKRVFQS